MKFSDDYLSNYHYYFQGRKATITFIRPTVLSIPQNIFGLGFFADDTVLHEALQKYQESKIPNKEDCITQRLILDLPFDPEPRGSSELLDHRNEIVCSMSLNPQRDFKQASRCLVLTFKEKPSNYTSSKKAVAQENVTAQNAHTGSRSQSDFTEH